ncbi:PREDICTED: rho GTPase-activating protein gacF-like, partial [Rhagoletis zephyria]|uniref:rho GTPase-activating protein gacF-like n=1 Tax=Rhagoletis zephyria TaxID=28612 RepID=UPI0008113860
AEKKVIIVARSAVAPTSEPIQKPTVAPLRTSTPLPPVAEIKPTAAPTKEPVAIVNEPPKLTTKTTEKEVTLEVAPEAHPLSVPPTTNVSAPQEQALPKQTNPLLVTGFITENGNIYEVTDKNGIGMIEPRQSSQSDVAEQHVCNYGAIVIYSDVPCNEANVRIGDVHHKVLSLAHREQMPEESQQSPIVVQQVSADKNVTTSGDANANSADSHANNDETIGDVDVTQPKPAKKRRRVNKNSSNKRRRNGYDSRPNSVRQGSGSRRRQQAEQQQQRRRLQNNRNKQQKQRKRVQQQQEEEPFRRRTQYTNSNGQRRHGSKNNKRRYVVYDDYDY